MPGTARADPASVLDSEAGLGASPDQPRRHRDHWREEVESPVRINPVAEERVNHIGTIEHTRKMLAFLETLSYPSDAVLNMIRQYRAEVAGWEYANRPSGEDGYAEARGYNR